MKDFLNLRIQIDLMGVGMFPLTHTQDMRCF